MGHCDFHIVVKAMWLYDHINDVGVSQRSSLARDLTGQHTTLKWNKESFKHMADVAFFLLYLCIRMYEMAIQPLGDYY